MIKKTLYFILKSPFDIKILKFFFWFFGHFEKRIDAKNKINLKIPDVITWETIAIYILPNIPRSKSNQLTKFGKLIEHVMRNIFLKKIIHKMWWISSLKFLIIVRQFESYRNVLKLNWRSLAFISSYLGCFKKQKEVWSYSLAHYCTICDEKYLSSYILLIDQFSFYGCLYFVRNWAILVL